MDQPLNGQGDQRPELRRSRQVAEEELRRLDRLSPLIHDLLTWDLVHRTDSGAFVLREDVQRRLAEASARQAHSAPEVYVGRPCRRCGRCGVTRMVDGVRLCDPCSHAAAADEPVLVDPQAARRHHAWRNHKAG
jgi:ribosomal protein L37AE/L43A